jgi:hypothetical protein
MAVNDVYPKMLKAPTFLGTTDTIIVCNTDSTERWVTLAYDGSTDSEVNCFVYRLPIAANDTVVLDTALVFESTDTLRGRSDTANKITVCATGWERQTA